MNEKKGGCISSLNQVISAHRFNIKYFSPVSNFILKMLMKLIVLSSLCVSIETLQLHELYLNKNFWSQNSAILSSFPEFWQYCLDFTGCFINHIATNISILCLGCQRAAILTLWMETIGWSANTSFWTRSQKRNKWMPWSFQWIQEITGRGWRSWLLSRNQFKMVSTPKHWADFFQDLFFIFLLTAKLGSWRFHETVNFAFLKSQWEFQCYFILPLSSTKTHVHSWTLFQAIGYHLSATGAQKLGKRPMSSCFLYAN